MSSAGGTATNEHNTGPEGLPLHVLPTSHITYIYIYGRSIEVSQISLNLSDWLRAKE